MINFFFLLLIQKYLLRQDVVNCLCATLNLNCRLCNRAASAKTKPDRASLSWI